MSSLAEKSELKLKQLKAKVEEEKKRIQIRKNKEESRKLIEKGKIIRESALSNWDKETLLGAMIEIKERSLEEESLHLWKKRGKERLDKNQNKQLIVSFKKEINEEVKILLKKMHFYWNRFRKEWYGKGKKAELSEKFKSLEIVIEEVS